MSPATELAHLWMTGITSPVPKKAPGHEPVFQFNAGTKHPLIDSTPRGIDHKPADVRVPVTNR